MKKMALILLIIPTLLLNGCILPGALLSLFTARSVYQGYESFSSLKDIKGKLPIFKDYRDAFVLIESQPRKYSPAEVNTAMQSTYSRTVNEMARELGLDLFCRPYNGPEVSNTQDALIIQVEEVKPSLFGKIVSGEKIHASVKFIDRRTAKCLDEETFNSSSTYKDLIGMVSFSTMLKMTENKYDAKKQTTPQILKSLMENRDKYPIMTAQEKSILSQG